jgi:hypothetical protein
MTEIAFRCPDCGDINWEKYFCSYSEHEDNPIMECPCGSNKPLIRVLVMTESELKEMLPEFFHYAYYGDCSQKGLEEPAKRFLEKETVVFSSKKWDSTKEVFKEKEREAQKEKEEK